MSPPSSENSELGTCDSLPQQVYHKDNFQPFPPWGGREQMKTWLSEPDEFGFEPVVYKWQYGERVDIQFDDRGIPCRPNDEDKDNLAHDRRYEFHHEIMSAQAGIKRRRKLEKAKTAEDGEEDDNLDGIYHPDNIWKDGDTCVSLLDEDQYDPGLDMRIQKAYSYAFSTRRFIGSYTSEPHYRRYLSNQKDCSHPLRYKLLFEEIDKMIDKMDTRYESLPAGTKASDDDILRGMIQDFHAFQLQKADEWSICDFLMTVLKLIEIDMEAFEDEENNLTTPQKRWRSPQIRQAELTCESLNAMDYKEKIAILGFKFLMSGFEVQRCTTDHSQPPHGASANDAMDRESQMMLEEDMEMRRLRAKVDCERTCMVLRASRLVNRIPRALAEFRKYFKVFKLDDTQPYKPGTTALRPSQIARLSNRDPAAFVNDGIFSPHPQTPFVLENVPKITDDAVKTLDDRTMGFLFLYYKVIGSITEKGIAHYRFLCQRGYASKKWNSGNGYSFVDWDGNTMHLAKPNSGGENELVSLYGQHHESMGISEHELCADLKSHPKFKEWFRNMVAGNVDPVGRPLDLFVKFPVLDDPENARKPRISTYHSCVLTDTEAERQEIPEEKRPTKRRRMDENNVDLASSPRNELAADQSEEVARLENLLRESKEEITKLMESLKKSNELAADQSGEFARLENLLRESKEEIAKSAVENETLTASLKKTKKNLDAVVESSHKVNMSYMDYMRRVMTGELGNP